MKREVNCQNLTEIINHFTLLFKFYPGYCAMCLFNSIKILSRKCKRGNSSIFAQSFEILPVLHCCCLLSLFPYSYLKNQKTCYILTNSIQQTSCIFNLRLNSSKPNSYLMKTTNRIKHTSTHTLKRKHNVENHSKIIVQFFSSQHFFVYKQTFCFFPKKKSKRHRLNIIIYIWGINFVESNRK